MKLIDLDPRWCTAARWDTPDGTMHFEHVNNAPETIVRRGMGLTFNCPVHRNHRLGVMFANPIDGLPGDATAKYRWHRDGDTFETLTLGPSIDASGNKADVGEHVGMIQTPCWHGFITNGEIR